MVQLSAREGHDAVHIAACIRSSCRMAKDGHTDWAMDVCDNVGLARLGTDAMANVEVH